MDIPLRITQSGPLTVNNDGIPATVSPDAADSLTPAIISQMIEGSLLPASVVNQIDLTDAITSIITSGSLDYGAPKQTSAPILQGIPQGIKATWDGINADGSTTRVQDWHHLDVHMSTVSGFTPSATTVVASIVASNGGSGTSPSGGSCVIPCTDYTDLEYVSFIAVSVSGQRSSPSAQSSARPLQITNVDVQKLSLLVTAFKNLNHYLY